MGVLKLTGSASLFDRVFFMNPAERVHTWQGANLVVSTWYQAYVCRPMTRDASLFNNPPPHKRPQAKLYAGVLPLG